MTPSGIEPEKALDVSYTLNPQHVRIDRLINSCWELWETGGREGQLRRQFIVLYYLCKYKTSRQKN